MSEEHKSLKQIIDYRKEKLLKIKESGIDPFPQKFTPNHFSKDIIHNFDKLQNKDVILAGRIMSIRKMGKASFFQSFMMSNISFFDDGVFVCIAIHPESVSLGVFVTMRCAVSRMSSKAPITLLIFKRSSGVPYALDAAFCIMRIADWAFPLVLFEVKLSGGLD